MSKRRTQVVGASLGAALPHFFFEPISLCLCGEFSCVTPARLICRQAAALRPMGLCHVTIQSSTFDTLLRLELRGYTLMRISILPCGW